MAEPIVPPNPSETIPFIEFVKSLPYDKRWNALRPVLEPLFYRESTKDIMKMMRDRYQFDANEAAYKYRFSKVWKLSKNIPENVKAAALRKGMGRAKEGKQSIAKYRGRNIPASRFQIANSMFSGASSLSLQQLFTVPLAELNIFGRYTPFGNNILLAWNMPFENQTIMRHALSPRDHTSSPFNTNMGNTPNDLEMTTPSDHAHSPQISLLNENNNATLTSALREHRGRLFVEGNFAELLKAMSTQERSGISTYFYQFWYFSFASAQGWSPYARPTIEYGIETSDLQKEDADVEMSHPGSSPDLVSQSQELHGVPLPPQSCGWAVHVSDLSIISNTIDLPTVPAPVRHPPVTEVVTLETVMRTSLESGSFIDVLQEDIAIPFSDITTKTKQSSDDLLQEAIGFAIMGRNLDLLRTLLDKVITIVRDIGKTCARRTAEWENAVTNINFNLTYALHLATTYMDGGSVCCLIVHELAQFAMYRPFLRNRNLINENDHTLIDNMLLNILRSHSTVSLSTVDSQLHEVARYSGQEVDICGRWTATSLCFKGLLASGQSNIPPSWKHKFCRTSTQVICHSISSLLRHLPSLCTQGSGLFVHRCLDPDCGQVCVLGPLHAVVMTSYYLIKDGAPDEDLFGMLACYLALVDAGVDPLSRNEISASQLLGTTTDKACNHREQTAAGLAREVSQLLTGLRFPKLGHVGFAVLLAVIEEAEKARHEINQLMTDIPDDIPEPVHRAFYVFNDMYCEKDLFVRKIDAHIDSDSDNDEGSDGDSMIEDRLFAKQRQTRLLLEGSFPCKCNGIDSRFCDHQMRSMRVVPAFGNSMKLGHIWAAVQAELSSTRLEEIQSQESSSLFDMQRLLSSLTDNSIPNIEHLRNKTLKEYCRCGRFADSQAGFATRESIFVDSSHGLGDDMTVWARTSFIETVECPL